MVLQSCYRVPTTECLKGRTSVSLLFWNCSNSRRLIIANLSERSLSLRNVSANYLTFNPRLCGRAGPLLTSLNLGSSRGVSLLAHEQMQRVSVLCWQGIRSSGWEGKLQGVEPRGAQNQHLLPTHPQGWPDPLHSPAQPWLCLGPQTHILQFWGSTQWRTQSPGYSWSIKVLK